MIDVDEEYREYVKGKTWESQAAHWEAMAELWDHLHAAQKILQNGWNPTNCVREGCRGGCVACKLERAIDEVNKAMKNLAYARHPNHRYLHPYDGR